LIPILAWEAGVVRVSVGIAVGSLLIAALYAVIRNTTMVGTLLTVMPIAVIVIAGIALLRWIGSRKRS
jgi:hypothetical protein